MIPEGMRDVLPPETRLRAVEDRLRNLRSRQRADAAESPALEEQGIVAACSAQLVAGRSARVLRRDEVNALADALRAVVEER